MKKKEKKEKKEKEYCESQVEKVPLRINLGNAGRRRAVGGVDEGVRRRDTEGRRGRGRKSEEHLFLTLHSGLGFVSAANAFTRPRSALPSQTWVRPQPLQRAASITKIHT
ncbi:hypothetical protein E2C01_017154 [Portunus trituberculatus]|uniref:Uncharacterized protein n=1 Tax=Portunus trituberculatus TaxID=210409 RepID=A0A5B7DSU2_PORTR|nr:hypothetical protein [Portunus trituberculatus]